MGKIFFLTCTVATLITWGLITWNQNDLRPVKVTHTSESNTQHPLAARASSLGVKPARDQNDHPKISAITASQSRPREPAVDQAPSTESEPMELTEPRDMARDDFQKTIANELNRAQSLNNAWLEEKKQFYQENLHLSDEEILELYHIDDVADEAIHELTQKLSDNPAETSEQEYMETVRGVVATYEQDAHGILGDDGIAQMKEFRTRFNDKSYARFGTHVKQMGF